MDNVQSLSVSPLRRLRGYVGGEGEGQGVGICRGGEGDDVEHYRVHGSLKYTVYIVKCLLLRTEYKMLSVVAPSSSSHWAFSPVCAGPLKGKELHTLHSGG